MLIIVLLLVSNAYAVGCLSNYDDELNHYTTLNLEVDKKISELGLDQQVTEQYKKSIVNDPIGNEIEQSKKCLESMNSAPKIDDFNSTFYPFIGAVAGSIGGAIIVIYGSEKIQHGRIIKNGKIAINHELHNVKTILEKKTESPDKELPFQYSPYDISTTAFDSVISSGTFLHFPIELQENLVVIYFYIKQHNILLQNLTNMIIKTQTESVLPDTAQVLIRYYEEIVINEKWISQRYLDRLELLGF